MIHSKTVVGGLEALNAAIAHLADAALQASEEMPATGFQAGMRFAGLARTGEDIATLAAAAKVLLRRSGQDREPT